MLTIFAKKLVCSDVWLGFQYASSMDYQIPLLFNNSGNFIYPQTMTVTFISLISLLST